MTGTIGALLKAWRRQKNLTGADLAGQAGISRATLTRWESGQTQPRMVELEAVLTALAASPAQRQEALAHLQAPRAVKLLREVAGGLLPPVRGDLLRTMRLRQGWTQQQTAQKAGIAQSTLARWERTEDWPSAERLHSLCYVLHAQEAELIALTQGVVTEALPLETLLDSEAVRIQVAHYMFASTQADVEFMAFESQLWQLAQKENAAENHLSYTYGSHARFLMERQRWAEAASYVERVHQLAHNGQRAAVSLACAAIAASRIVGEGQRTPNPAHAVKILQGWVDSPFLQEREEYRAWMLSEIAKWLMKMGERDSALCVSRQAIRMAERVDPAEPWWRRGDYARVLIDAGRGEDALEECNAFLSLGEPAVNTLPFLLTGAQAYAAIGRPNEAADWLQKMGAILAAHPEAAHYLAPIEALQQRL
jgi:transcriptional regulator with XRE-family HTH domain